MHISWRFGFGTHANCLSVGRSGSIIISKAGELASMPKFSKVVFSLGQMFAQAHADVQCYLVFTKFFPRSNKFWLKDKISFITALK
jgi:hypothetical protein